MLYTAEENKDMWPNRWLVAWPNRWLVACTTWRWLAVSHCKESKFWTSPRVYFVENRKSMCWECVPDGWELLQCTNWQMNTGHSSLKGSDQQYLMPLSWVDTPLGPCARPRFLVLGNPITAGQVTSWKTRQKGCHAAKGWRSSWAEVVSPWPWSRNTAKCEMVEGLRLVTGRGLIWYRSSNKQACPLPPLKEQWQLWRDAVTIRASLSLWAFPDRSPNQGDPSHWLGYTGHLFWFSSAGCCCFLAFKWI